MRILLGKLKKTNKLFLGLYLVVFIVYLIVYILLIKNLLSLSGIETVIRMVVIAIFGIWLIVYFLWNLINLVLKKHIKIIVTSVISVILIVIFSVANYYISVLYTGIENLAENEYVTYTSNLITLNGTTINNESRFGMINSSLDIEGNVLALELIKDKGLEENEIVSYSSYYEMIYALLNKEVDGIFLTSNYMTIFGSEEGFEELKNTKAAYTYSKKMENRDTQIVSSKKLTEPFTILLMGVDSAAQKLDANASFNGDTLMLITFNPKTLNATMFSIPRDTYVPITCNNNRYAKINSSAAYGTSCVIKTIEQFSDITIDYYVKVNFKGVVDLVEALGGVDVDVEVPDYKVYYRAYGGRVCEQNSLRQFGDQLICMDTGMQHLDGEQALAYARCRHAYLQSDIARNKHQQQIIESIARKLASPSNISRIEELLNAVTNNLATNMDEKQILSFYEVMKNMISKSFSDGDFLSIQKTYMEYYNLPVRLSNNGIFTSAIGHYPDSLKAITNLMKANLGLEEQEMIKTFSFDANEEYTTQVTGQGITSGGKLETMPNFVGASISKVEDWALNHNIELKKEFVDSNSPHYNKNGVPGVVGKQSVSNGVLLKNVNELTIYINNVVSPPPVYDIPQDTDDDDNNDVDLPDVILPSESNDENDKTNQE